jgi:hypothetical protein
MLIDGNVLVWVCNFADQARAMELAIKDVLPDMTHRWCKWHVLRKAKESFGVVYGKKSDFKHEFHKLVHHMITKE